jgi:hypothetical protein
VRTLPAASLKSSGNAAARGRDKGAAMYYGGGLIGLIILILDIIAIVEVLQSSRAVTEKLLWILLILLLPLIGVLIYFLIGRK